MATRKGKSAEAPGMKAASRHQPTEGGTPSVGARTASAAVSDGMRTQRLLREAAWSRMFGRTEPRNPFGRTR